MPEFYWTVSYSAEGRRWWAVSQILRWGSTDDWTKRDRLDEATAREVYEIFKRNPENSEVRMVRVTRRAKVGNR